MHLEIAGVLDTDTVADIRRRLEGVRFEDGRRTAGWHARLVKENLQARRRDPVTEEVLADIERRLLDHTLFRIATRPKRFASLILSRYEPGMRYGTHVDDALMGGVRTDVSFTLFLADPGEYDGGELVIDTPGGEIRVKPPAGSLYLYPSTTLHRVEEVTRGVRLAAVGWVRSFVRDAAKREILFDLETARQQEFAAHGKSAGFDLVSKSLTNLLRLWAED